MTEEEARHFDAAAGYSDSRLKDDLNKIGRRLEKRFEIGNTDNGKPISGTLKDQISGLFVQAPVHPGSFIDSFINENVASAARKRSERRSVAQAMATIAASVDDAGSVTEAMGDAGRSDSMDSMEVESIGGSVSLELHFDPDPDPLVNSPPARVVAFATTPDVYNLAIACRYLSERFIWMNRDVDMFCSNLQVQKFTKLVFIVEGGTLVKLDDNAFMVKCNDAVQEGCQLFKICKSAPTNSESLCDCCSKRRKVKRKREQRRSRSNTDRTDPSSRAPTSSMSPSTLIKKVKTKYSLQLSGHNKLVRYNKRVLRSALAFWLESPSAYERLRNSSIEILPSAPRLQKRQRELISHEGPFPECYGWFQDERRGSDSHVAQPYDDHIVEVLFDEMNLRTEVVTNISNQRTTGFTILKGY